MIPKIIHYCWFGGEKPRRIERCIKRWKTILPDYKIIEWNQNNFDINEFQYTSDAYRAKKFAFVSDVARAKALMEYGGIYLDTDVKVFKTFDSILKHRCVFGFEEGNYVATSFMAAESNHPVMKKLYDGYRLSSFYDAKGEIIPGTNVTKLTCILNEYGLRRDNSFQILDKDITIYPQEYFSPYDYTNCIHRITNNTICEHLFYVSWLPWQVRLKKNIKKIVGPIVGKKGMNKLRKTINLLCLKLKRN